MKYFFYFVSLLMNLSLSNDGNAALKIIAHMGDSMGRPENTLSAFKQAEVLGVKWIELDARVTRDRVPVVIHDPVIYRDDPTLESYFIKNLTFQDLRTFDVGGWFGKEFQGETVPTLEEVLQFSPQHLCYIVEIKWPGKDFKEDVNAILQVLQKHEAHCIVGSMVPAVVSYIQQQAPQLSVVGIVVSENALEQFVQMTPFALALRQQLINPNRIQELHNQGYEIWGWTIDDPYHVMEYAKMGLDGVITNNVKRMLEIFGS